MRKMNRGQIEAAMLAATATAITSYREELAAIRTFLEVNGKGSLYVGMTPEVQVDDFMVGVTWAISEMLDGMRRFELEKIVAESTKRAFRHSDQIDMEAPSPLTIYNEALILSGRLPNPIGRILENMGEDEKEAIRKLGASIMQGMSDEMFYEAAADHKCNNPICPIEAEKKRRAALKAGEKVEETEKPEFKIGNLEGSDVLKSLGIVPFDNPNLTEEPYEDDEEAAG